MRERTEDVSGVRVVCGAPSQCLSVDTHMAVGADSPMAGVGDWEEMGGTVAASEVPVDLYSAQ